MVDAKSILKKMLKFSFVPVASALLTVFVLPYVSRVFPTEEYGKINLFYSTANILMYVFLVGLDNAYIRYYYESDNKGTRKKLLSFALFTGIILNFTVFAVLTIFSGNALSFRLFGEENRMAIIALAIFTGGQIAFRMLNLSARMEMNAFRYNLQNIIQIFITRVSYCIVAVYSVKYIYSVWCMAISGFLFMAFYLWKQRKEFTFRNVIPEKKMRVDLFKFGLPGMASCLALYMNSYVGKLVLTWSGNYGDIGVLAIATTLASIFTIIPSAFSTFWSPFMYENYKDQQPMIKKTHNYVVFTALVIVIGIVAFQDILYLLLGEKYRVSQAYFMLIMLNPIQNLINETTSYGISIVKKTYYSMMMTIIGVILNIVACFIFAPRFGAMGAAIGVAVSSVFLWISMTVIGQKYYSSITSPAKTFIGSVLILALCIANSFICDKLVLRLLVCLAFFVIGFLLYRKEVSEAVGSALSSLKNRKKHNG